MMVLFDTKRLHDVIISLRSSVSYFAKRIQIITSCTNDESSAIRLGTLKANLNKFRRKFTTFVPIPLKIWQNRH